MKKHPLPPETTHPPASSVSAEALTNRPTPQIEFVDISRPKPNLANARTHSKHQLKLIARSIERFGFINPILVDRNDRIIAGHGRLAAAQQLGQTLVPVLRIEHLGEEDLRAYVLAENKLSELGGWDREILSIELQGLIEIGYDLELTGFATAEIDLLFEETGSEPADAKGNEGTLPEVSPIAISRPGDLWRLGPHRLLCGDARDLASYARLLQGAKADVVCTDVPFNVPIAGHVSGKGNIKHREFAMASGEMSEAEFTHFLQTTLGNAAEVSRDGAVHFIFMDWRHLTEILAATRIIYASQLNLCVWAKDNGGMGSLYRSQHELVLVFKVGTAPHINNVQLGRFGRYRTNVWNYAGVNSFSANRLEQLAMHPTVKPVALVADAIKDVSNVGDVVLDAFAGSGTTIIAAHKTQRRGFCLEIDPHYVDVAVRRWQSLTGEAAVLDDTQVTFEQREREVLAQSSSVDSCHV